jgi:transcriptional regulator with XRE-family HTH domain
MPDTIDTRKLVLRRKIVGVRIRQARMKAGLTLKEVGQALGITAEQLSEIEFGLGDVSLPQLEVMALLFHVPISDFWSEDLIEEEPKLLPTVEAISLRRRIIGGLLRHARTEAGRSPEDLAALLGVSSSRIAEYELAQAEIPLLELEILAKYLNVSLDYFIDGGLPNFNNSEGRVNLEEIARFFDLPKDIRDFLSNPANLLYVNIAMRLSDLSADTLRNLAEGLLEVTY